MPVIFRLDFAAKAFTVLWTVKARTDSITIVSCIYFKASFLHLSSEVITDAVRQSGLCKDPRSSSSSESEDEPVNKLRRLSTSSVSCGSCCGSPCPSPCPDSRSRHTRCGRPRRWSAYDSSLSESGSYIETPLATSCSSHAHETKDDYVCVSGESECGVAPFLPTPTTQPQPEPMVVEPEEQPLAATPSTDLQNLETPDVGCTSYKSLALGVQDHDMVGSAGLDTVRARCGQQPSADILAEVAMIQDAVKSPTATATAIDGEMENVNQVNGNTMISPAATEDSGLNLTSPSTEASVSSETSPARESPSKTSCTNVERPSPNCATFDFKHQDTDTEEAATNTTTSTATAACQANLNLVDYDPSRNRVYQIRRRAITTVRRVSARTRLEFSGDEEVDQEALQKIIDTAVPDDLDWLNSNMPSDIDFSGGEEEYEAPVHEQMDTGSDGGTAGQQQHTPEQHQGQHETQRAMSKESLTRLVSDAERLVREPVESDEPPPVVSPRPHLQLPLPLNGGSGYGGVSSKQARVKQWIASQRREVRHSATCVLDSCDASGELTTGESDIESASSDDMDASTATQHATSTRSSVRGSLRGSRDPLPSADNTPTTERINVLPLAADAAQTKVVLRNRKRRSGEQRPWSVSELYQLATHLDLAPYSVSETALHNLLTATPETPTNDNQAFGMGQRDVIATGSSSLADCTTPTTTTTTTTNPTTASTPTTATFSNISNSAIITTSITPSTGRISPTTGTGSLRRRKTRARRKSNLSLGRRTDSGSEGITLNLSGGSDSIHMSPSRRLSLSKSHSSGSDTTSHSRRHIVKSSSFSGEARRTFCGMTPSTEKCVSDCGGVLGVPRTVLHVHGENHYTSDDSRPCSPVPVIKELASNPSPAHAPHSAPHMSDQDGQNTHEDMSSLSEQAWDPYQEYKYLSEPYSEDIDQEAARRLLEFGDDYRKYIDSDGASSFSGIPHRGRRSPHHRRLRSLAPPGPRDLDSDSDLDDLHHVIDESRSQLTVTENVLKKYSNEAALGLDYAELVATTQTNIKCLAEVVRHLQMEGTLEPELQEVQSWASTSDDSPAPLDPGTTLPLPGTHATRKVPKVTRLLRETQVLAAAAVVAVSAVASSDCGLKVQILVCGVVVIDGNRVRLGGEKGEDIGLGELPCGVGREWRPKANSGSVAHRLVIHTSRTNTCTKFVASHQYLTFFDYTSIWLGLSPVPNHVPETTLTLNHVPEATLTLKHAPEATLILNHVHAVKLVYNHIPSATLVLNHVHAATLVSNHAHAVTLVPNQVHAATLVPNHVNVATALQALQQEVSARKIEVSSINLAVHRFLTDTGYSLARLKDDVADLFRLWDEADRRVSSELTRLGVVEDTWKRWETEADELSRALRQDGDTLKVLDAAIQTGSLTDTVTASVQGVARLLNDRRKTQPGKKLLLQHTKAQVRNTMPLFTLSTAETELKGLQKHCRELVVRSAETLDQAKTSPQLRRRSWTRDSKVGRASRRGNSIGGVSGRRGWMWRVVRAALPFQAALLLLFCVACLLEPNCCDHVNTLNLSLSPQVRYVHGPPPV
nr:klarsicht protein-like [Cherax quadricarinatus]